MNNFNNSRGFTLVELLVALGLGVLLSFGLVQIFQNTRMLANTETALSRVQEVGRYAMDIVSKELRMVGYHGCSDPNNMDVTVMATNGVGDFAGTTLEAYEVSNAGAFSPALTAGNDLEAIQSTTAASGNKTARPGSDVIRIKYASRTGAALTGNTDPNNANVVFDDNPTCLDQGDIVIVSDCSSAHIFRNTNNTCQDDGTPNANNAGEVTFAHASNGNVVNKIEPGYSAGASLLAYHDLTFFVADTGRNTPQGDDVYALYRKHNGGNPEELVEGVEFLQFQYGETLSSGNVRYVSANTAGVILSDVSTIYMGMLVQGLENASMTDDKKSYDVAGTTIPASGLISHSGGQYLRKPFVTTIKLRNRRL